jgi:hypothetical protein
MLDKLLLRNIRLGGVVYLPLAYVVWFLLAAIAALSEISRGTGSIDNYLLFRGVFYHVLEQKNLFIFYPDEYVSFNNYGPAFSLIIAPFAVLPLYVGCFLWAMANAAVLFIAIGMLPVSRNNQVFILWLVCLEMMTATHSVQSNPFLTASFIFAFVYTQRGKEGVATLFIAIAILTKIYGVAALIFFFFSPNKKQFILYLLMWLAVLFFLPMLYSSYDYIIQTYQDWYHQIIMRNRQNIDSSLQNGMQDISVQGMVRRIFHYYRFPDIVLFAIVALLYFIPITRRKQFNAPAFRLYYLGITLISMVIFSPAAESPTFVIAVTGCGIWLVFRQRPLRAGALTLLLLLFFLTILSPTDIVPSYIREHIIRAYSLKALPPFLVWCWMIYELWRKDFTKTIAVCPPYMQQRSLL